MKDVMLDFETLGNGKDKCLCQVGAVFFDNVTGELGEEFKANIDAKSHVEIGGKIDAETVYWWLAQSQEAQKSITVPPGRAILDVITELNAFLAPASRVWSHATFDFVTLLDTCRQLGIKCSVPYRAGLDLRTLVYLANVSTSSFVREGVHHDGLEDAKHQVRYCVAALNAVKTNKQAIRFLENLNK